MKHVAAVITLVCVLFLSIVPTAHAQERNWMNEIPEGTKQALFEAQQAMNEQEYGKAIEILTAHQKKHPKSNHFLLDFNIGTAYALSGNTDEAIIYLEKAISLEPNYGAIWQNIGKLYYDKKEYAKAGKALERGFRLADTKDPGVLYVAMAAYYQAENIDLTISLGEELLLKIKKDDADILSLLVNAYIQKKDYSGAITTLTQLQHWRPGDAKLWKLLAQLYINNTEYAKATIAYEIYGYLAGLTREELWNLGDLFAMIGVPVRAAQYYSRALEDGGSDEEYEKLATAYYTAYRFIDAINALNQALEKKDTSDRLILKAQLHYLQDDFKEAETTYANAAKLHTKDGHEWLMAGYCAMRHGNKQQAKQWLLKASEFPNQRKEAQNLLQLLIEQEKLRNSVEEAAVTNLT